MEDSFHLGIKALVRNSQGKILLLQVNPAKLKAEKQAYWDLPGGRIQKDETVISTLEREVKEETGLTGLEKPVEVGMVLSNIRIPLGDSSVGLILNIYSVQAPESATIAISDEHIAYDWFAPAEAAAMLRVKYPDAFCDKIAQLV